MGTKLQYAIHPLILGSPTESFSAYQLEDWDSFRIRSEQTDKLQRPSFNKAWDLIYRMLEPHHIESIKKTMLMHEDLFKHQVKELHRLYSVQRMLMNELKNEIKHKRFWGISETGSAGFLSFQSQTNSVREVPSSQERSASCSGEMVKIKPKGFNLEMPAEEDHEDMSNGVSATAMDEENRKGDHNIINSLVDDCSNLELTLSIGGSSSSICRINSRSHKKNSSLKLDENMEALSSSSIKTVDDTKASSSTTINQENKQQPHWFLQDLK